MFNHLNLIIMFVDRQKEHLDKLSYPLRVIELWCRNTRQLNPYRKPLLSDLISDSSCANYAGGFTWGTSRQGDSAWRLALKTVMLVV